MPEIESETSWSVNNDVTIEPSDRTNDSPLQKNLTTELGIELYTCWSVGNDVTTEIGTEQYINLRINILVVSFHDGM